MSSKKNRNQRETILRQYREIEALRKKILEIDEKSEDELSNSIDVIYGEWVQTIEEINKKRKEYFDLFTDLQEIKKIMKENNFKIPWYRKLSKKFR